MFCIKLNSFLRLLKMKTFKVEDMKVSIGNKVLFHKNEKDIIVSGHRGICAHYPENTMLSYRKAIELGVDQLEIDVNMTSDRKLVLIHDPWVDRTTEKSGSVRKFTLEQIKKMDAGSHKSDEFKGEQIPELRELLELIAKTDISLNVEIKDRTFEVVDATVKMLLDYGMKDRFVIACFDANIIHYAHQKYGVMTQGFPDDMQENFSNETRAHMYAVGIPMWALTKKLVSEYKECGIQPWAWCPDTEEEVEKAVECGARLLTCNDPAPALKVLSAMKLR